MFSVVISPSLLVELGSSRDSLSERGLGLGEKIQSWWIVGHLELYLYLGICIWDLGCTVGINRGRENTEQSVGEQIQCCWIVDISKVGQEDAVFGIWEALLAFCIWHLR